MKRGFLKRIPRPSPDLWIALAIFALAAVVGGLYVNQAGTFQFYQHKYGPAAMLATGRGFFNPDVEAVPALGEFLNQQTPRLDSEALPEIIPAVAFDNMQLLYLYTQFGVAAIWAVFGVSWAALSVLFGLLYGVSSALAYGLFRLGIRRPLALAAALLFLSAPLQLELLPWLRDYGKAPFMLAILLLLGALVKGEFRRWRVVALSAAFGLVVGIGLGCRDDVMTAIPFFAGTLFLFTPGGAHRNLRWKMAALALAGLLFLATAAPVLHVRAGIGACTGDHIYLGLLDRCALRLGVGGTPYSFGGPYSDNLMVAITQNHAHRVLAFTETPAWYTPEYDTAGMDLIRRLAWTFPADFVARAYAAVLRILDGLRSAAPAPHGVEAPWLLSAFAWRHSVAALLYPYSRYQALLALLVLAAINRRQGLFLLGLALYFLGINAIQFNLRHHFHLAIVSLWVAFFLIDRAAWFAEAAFRKERRAQCKAWLCQPRAHWARPFRSAAYALLLVCVGMPAALFTLRAYQHVRAVDFIAEYTHADLRRLERVEETPRQGIKRIAGSGFARHDRVPEPRRHWPIQATVLAIDVDAAGQSVPLSLRYDPEIPGIDWPGNDFSWQMVIPQSPPSSGPTRVFVPIYFTERSSFLGVELDEKNAGRIRALHGFEDERDVPDLPLFLVLAPGWEEGPLSLRLLGH